MCIRDSREELEATLVGDLIDPDPAQPGEPVVDRFDISPDPVSYTHLTLPTSDLV